MTKSKIESHLPKGYFLDKAEGVWYFCGNDSHLWANTCSNFCTLDQGTLTQWIDIFEYLQENYEESKGVIYE